MAWHTEICKLVSPVHDRKSLTCLKGSLQEKQFQYQYLEAFSIPKNIYSDLRHIQWQKETESPKRCICSTEASTWIWYWSLHWDTWKINTTQHIQEDIISFNAWIVCISYSYCSKSSTNEEEKDSKSQTSKSK